MKMSALENIAFEKEAILGVASKATAEASKKAIPLGVTALTAAAVLPHTLKSTSYNNYKGKMDNPVAYKKKENFGKPMDYTYAEKMGEDMSPMTFLEKVAAAEPMSWMSGAFKNMKDLPYGKLALTLGLGGAGATVAGPSLKTIGEKTHRKLFSRESRLNEKDEIEKARIKAMGQYLADRDVKQYSSQFNQMQDTPKITGIVNGLTSSDPVLMNAAKDKKSQDIMNKTVAAVYSFSPSLAKNERAMQSILTEAVTSPEGGLSFQTIKSLAETQGFVNKNKG